jgi:purine nucleoside phosphorylase
MPRIGIIGGSGLYNMKGLEVIKKIAIDTPFGSPSGKIMIGRLDGIEVRTKRNERLKWRKTVCMCSVCVCVCVCKR